MKIFIFSHIADADGVTPIILSKLAFNDFDYKLLDNPINEVFLSYINTNDMSRYDYIFMTDLCINEDTITKLSDEFKRKFLIFDHHIANINMNKYNFIKVIDEKDGIKESGTSLYYRFLLNNFPNENLIKNSTQELVNYVKLGDTWTFTDENKQKSLNISSFLEIVGVNEYINYYYNFLINNKEFYFENKLDYLFNIERKRITNYILDMKNKVIPCHIKKYNVGVVFAENYRSILGNELCKIYEDVYDFIIIINMARSISLRGIKNIDLNRFANLYGGKGHKKAAGIPLPNNLKKQVIKAIFNDIELEDKNEY